MALKFDTRTVQSGRETSGERKRAAAHKFGKMKSVSLLGVIEVTQTKGKRKATVYVGETDNGYQMSKTTRGLKAFNSKDAVNAALKQAQAAIKKMEKPFAEIAQLPSA